jgi:nucleoside-diphosphate-sugar epimerase
LKHLVTGGSGFLGSLVVKRLVERGEEVVVLDIGDDESRPPGVAFVQGDILDRDVVARAMLGVEVVHHNVALVPIAKAGRRRFWDVNVTGSQIVAEEAVRAGAGAFVHQSSSAIFGAVEEMPVTNATVPHPVEAYGAAKLESERVVVGALGDAMPLYIVRPRTILGPGRLGIFGILFRWIDESRNVYVIGDGNKPFQFVHAEDLVGAYFHMLDLKRPGIYNVGTDRFNTLRQALDNLIAYVGSKSQVKGLPRNLTKNVLRVLDWTGLSPLGPYHYNVYGKAFYFDTEPLRELGWTARYSNDEMLRETYEFYRQHRDDSSGNQSLHRKPLGEKVLAVVRRFS